LVNTDRHLAGVIALARAAVSKGHEVALFAMDEGTRLLGNPACAELWTLPGVSVSVCELSATKCGVEAKALPQRVVWGSQYHNAVMVRDADRVIVL
jgi:predicted peroxiredoxin